MNTAALKPLDGLGNELASELFDACSSLKALQHQLDAIEGDEVHSVAIEANEAGRVLRRLYRDVYELAVLLADCQVAPHPGHEAKLRNLLGADRFADEPERAPA